MFTGNSELNFGAIFYIIVKKSLFVSSQYSDPLNLIRLLEMFLSK